MRNQTWTTGSRYGVIKNIIKNSTANNEIIFYVDGDKFIAKKGMTWDDFIQSKYNKLGIAKYTNESHIIDFIYLT